MSGIVLTGTSAPAIGSDGSNFRGRLVPKLLSNAYYRATGLATLLASGSRPHVIWVGRDTVGNYPGVGKLFDFGLTATSQDCCILLSATALSATGCGTVTGPAVADTSAHRMEYRSDATASTLIIDGTTYTGGAGSVGHNTDSIGIGIAAFSPLQPTSSNHGGLFVFSQALSAQQLTLMRQFLQQDFSL